MIDATKRPIFELDGERQEAAIGAHHEAGSA
jgi:hypothetical protein